MYICMYFYMYWVHRHNYNASKTIRFYKPNILCNIMILSLYNFNVFRFSNVIDAPVQISREKTHYYFYGYTKVALSHYAKLGLCALRI